MWGFLTAGARQGRSALKLLLAIGLAAVALDGHGTAPAAISQAYAVSAMPLVRQPLWVAGQAHPTAGWLAFCNQRPSECQIDPTEPAALTLTLATWDTLVAVNVHVNRTIRAMPDREHWGVQDRWDYPDDGIGDCEDIQLLKRKLLVEAGLPRRALRMAVVFDERGEGHAVLMALTDRGAFVLDNKQPVILPWNETGYTYLKREGSDGQAWASLVGRLSPVTGDVAEHMREKALSSAPATSSSSVTQNGL